MNDRLLRTTRSLAWGLGLILAGLWGGGPARAGDVVVSDAGQRTGLDLTVYNHDLALVRETRRLELPKGAFGCEFRDVPARINPVTLLVESTGGTGLTILEQNYEFDLLSPEKILDKYVGREISWIQEDGSRVKGRLLGTNGRPVFRVDGEIVFEVPGRLALPDLPEDLRARPTLVWTARTERSGQADVEASYLTNGLSWSADYVLELGPDGHEAGLQSWVSIDNRSGATFGDARLLLVAGDINQARPGRGVMMDMAEMAVKAPAGGFQEESLFDYHLYTLQRPTTVKDNQIKQVALFEAAGIGMERIYRLDGGVRLFRSLGQLEESPGIGVHYRFRNSEDNGLGVPLPAGVFRVYGRSAAGARQLLGEDRIGHTARDEMVELEVGRAFDLVAERVRTESRRVADNVYRQSFRITLRNHKDEDVTIQVIENVGGAWEVLSANRDHERRDAQTLVFAVPVAAGGESVLEYTVQATY